MEYFKITEGIGPAIGAAIHSGHGVRNDIKDKLLLSDEERLREEDPFTDKFIQFLPTQIIVDTSRFEFDLNRPEEKAIYLTPDDAWGLNVWKVSLTEEDISASVSLYQKFYETLKPLLKKYIDTYGKIFIYDVHSYNHMRNGPGGKPDDPLLNPDTNIGTGNIDSDYWRDMINDFMNDLMNFNYKDSKPDVKENVKFKGGYFSKWINENFGNDACVLSIEFKKTFMNEWTGKANNDKVETIKNALASTLPGVLNNLQKKISKV